MNVGYRNVRKFTAAESFMLYMEGLRELELYEEEAGKPADVPKSEAVLTRTLKASGDFLGQAVAEYPKDLLPRYYYALVLTLQGQAAQARQLQRDVEQHSRRLAELAASHPDYDRQGPASAPAPKAPQPTPSVEPTFQPSPSRDAEQRYQHSAEQFERTAVHAPSELQIYALYNEAQAWANRAQAVAAGGGFDKSRDLLDQALKILEGLDPGVHGLGSVGRIRLRIAQSASSAMGGIDLVTRQVASLVRRPWSLWGHGTGDAPRLAAGGTPEHDEAANESIAEGRALQFQVEMLKEFIQLWRLGTEGKLTITMFPARGAADIEHQTGVPERLRSLISAVEFAELPARAKEDLQAEYWNKWARLARTRAQTVQDLRERITLLELAAHYYETHLRNLNREGWTPGELNYAFVLGLQGLYELARQRLEVILGVAAKPAPAPLPKTTDVEEVKKYILGMPLGTPSTTVASLVTSAFGRLEPSTVQALVRALDHTNLKMEFIEEVVRGLNASSPSSPPRASP